MLNVQTIERLLDIARRREVLEKELATIDAEAKSVLTGAEVPLMRTRAEVAHDKKRAVTTPTPTPSDRSLMMRRVWATMSPAKRRRWVRNIKAKAIPAMVAARKAQLAAQKRAKG